MFSKLTKLINFIQTDFLKDYSAPFYDSNMMLCGAYRLTLYRHEHNKYRPRTVQQKACFR